MFFFGKTTQLPMQQPKMRTYDNQRVEPHCKLLARAEEDITAKIKIQNKIKLQMRQTLK